MNDQEYRRRVVALQERNDAEVLALCERIGFGFVMDSAARQWARRDPVGALTVGGCRGIAGENSNADS